MAPDPRKPIVDQPLIEAWVRHASYGEVFDFWAWERVNELVHADARTGWHLILALIAAVPDDLLGNVGVGPLEDLIGKHPAEVIDKVAKQAINDQRFLQALCQAWFTHGQLPPYVERRLVEVTHGVIRIFDVTV
jgi:hypothetical protein